MRKLTMHESLWGRVCSCGTCGSPPGFSKRDVTPQGIVFDTAEFKIACPDCRVPVVGLVLTEVVEQWNDAQVEAARAAR